MPVSKNPKISDQDTAIAQIYDNLVADLGQGQTATKEIFQRGGEGMGAAYQGASDQLQQGQAGMAQRMGEFLGVHGLGQAAPGAVAGAEGNYEFDMGQIARNRGVDLGSLAKQGTQYQAIGQLGIGNAQKEKAQTRVSAMERLQAVLAELEAARIQAAGEMERARLSARAASRGGGGSSDPMDALRAQKMGLEIQQMEQELQGGGEPVEWESGQRGLHQFLNSPNAYWENGANAATRSRVNNIINTTTRRIGEPSFRNSAGTFNTENMSPLDIALAGAQGTRQPGINQEALRMALELYYGGR